MLNRRDVLLVTAAALAAGPSCAAQASPSIKVYKDASCGCCTVWVDRLDAAGFKTEIDESQDMAAIKAKYGVPDDLTSCHTGVAGGYAIEGHVPPADIKRLLKAKPKALGIAVPGMPVNSPGMEVPGQPDEPYTVWLFAKDGTRSAFAKHGG
jgi:hypothetical protein